MSFTVCSTSGIAEVKCLLGHRNSAADMAYSNSRAFLQVDVSALIGVGDC